ncbi:MAG: polysaccharide biosynthesis protein [Actinomycetota bacterium]|nr:polysaccharide biosynthesis protein [Actinomycetota bacterium]
MAPQGSTGTTEAQRRPLGWPERIVSRLRRDSVLVLFDLGVTIVAYLTVLVLRFDGNVPGRFWGSFWTFLPALAGIHILTNYLFGLYTQMWRYASVQEAQRVVFAGGAAAGANLLFEAVTGAPLPFSVILLGAAFSLMGYGAIRFQSRLFSFRRNSRREERSRILLVGAGEAGVMVLKDILRSDDLGEPVAFVDDDPRKIGLAIHGVPVLGGCNAIPALVRRLAIDQVFLTIPSATSEIVGEVAAYCDEATVALRVLPSMNETLGGRVTGRDLREIRIEDLLGRQQVETDLASVASMMTGRRVLVTGAGGSIGSEIARQVLSFAPASLILLDHDETHLHDIVGELGEAPEVETVLADIRDQKRILSVFLRHRPEVVFHAAAHKHVPVLEEHPQEAVLTNIIGTANLADAAAATNVDRFVMISTDKAVNPISVMGASKWFAEQIVRSFEGTNSTFCAVRFGNVLGSRGSVIPTFLRQIQQGGPVTVTDENMVRYFMSIPEAVQLVLNAAALSEGGEVFTLDMGEPVRIVDLATKLIRLSGKTPGKDIEIQISGMRPGEKLVEDIVNPDEESVPSSHPSIVVSRPVVPNAGLLRRALRELEELSHQGRNAEISRRIKSMAARVDEPVVLDRVIRLDADLAPAAAERA